MLLAATETVPKSGGVLERMFQVGVSANVDGAGSEPATSTPPATAAPPTRMPASTPIFFLRVPSWGALETAPTGSKPGGTGGTTGAPGGTSTSTRADGTLSATGPAQAAASATTATAKVSLVTTA